MKKKEEQKCSIETCPMFLGLFLEGQYMSGQSKEAINKKLLKWFRMGEKTRKREKKLNI